MTLSFGQLIAFVVVLLVFALVIIAPFLCYLFYRDRREREASKLMGDSCHAFQREVTTKVLNAFTTLAETMAKCNEALTRNTEAFNNFDRRQPGGSVRT